MPTTGKSGLHGKYTLYVASVFMYTYSQPERELQGSHMNKHDSPRERADMIRQPARNAGLNGTEWADSEVHQLVDLWRHRVPFGRIAARIGRSRHSVVIKASRIGLTLRPYWHDEFAEKARRHGRVRPCLCCRRLFFSEGRGNRICTACKESSRWETGNDFSCA